MSALTAEEHSDAFLESPLTWRRTEKGLTYLPAADKLWRTVPSPLRARYRVLGVPLDFSSNSPDLLSLADDAFGGGANVDLLPFGKTKRLDIFLHDVAGAANATVERSPTMRMRGKCLLLNWGDSFGFADRAAGTATAFVTPHMAADRLRTQLTFIECLGMFLAAAERPVTLHAAAVVHQARCILLTGEQGSGKSTLAYACVRAGFQLLAEDVVFGNRIDDNPAAAYEVWGNPRFLHLLPDAVDFFPELARAAKVDQLNGERKLRIEVSRLGANAAVDIGSVWGVCSLGRSADRQTFLRTARRDSVHRALTHFEGDPPIDHCASSAAADRLIVGRVAHLEVGSDLEDAVRTLCRWIEAR